MFEFEDALIVDPILTTLNCQMLLLNVYPVGELNQIWVDVRDETSVTTDLVEQGHGTGAVLVKLHDRIELEMLQDRSILHQCRFLPKPTELQVSVNRRSKKVDSLASKSRQKRIGAAHLFRSSAMKRENARRPQGVRPLKFTKELHQTCRDSHPAIKKALTSRAAAVHKRRVQEMHEEMVHLRHDINLRTERAREERFTVGDVNHVQSFRWEDTELERLKELYDQSDNQMRSAALDRQDESPGVPSSGEQHLFHVVETQMGFFDARRNVPWFVREIARNRALFSYCAISAGPSGGSEWVEKV